MRLRLYKTCNSRRFAGSIRWSALLVCSASMTAFNCGAPAHAVGPWVQAEKIIGSDTDEYDQFGRSVGLNETRAVVGAPYQDEVGAAYLFDSATGDEIYKLVNQYGSVGDLFGHAVTINEDWIVVTAPSDDTKGVDAGAAYVFDLQSGDLIGSLFPEDPALGDFFGASIAIDGNLVIIGAVFDDDQGASSGSAYVFDLVSGEQIWKFVASDGVAGDFFGCSVDIDGDLCVVGAPQTDSDLPGKAYTFEIDTGLECHILSSSDGAMGDCFGQTVAIYENVAAIGACQDDDEDIDCGSVYLFDCSIGKEIGELHASDCGEGTFYGRSLSMDGNLLLIGSGSVGQRGGVAYIVDVETEMELARLVPFDQHSDDNFGRAVAIKGTQVFIGAYLDDDFGPDAGSAYFFRQYGPSNFLEISPMPLRSQEYGLFEMQFEQANERTWLLYSLTGLQPTYIRHLQIIVELQDPKLGFGPRETDGNGELILNLPIPGVAYPMDIWFQAVQHGYATNSVATMIVPER